MAFRPVSLAIHLMLCRSLLQVASPSTIGMRAPTFSPFACSKLFVVHLHVRVSSLVALHARTVSTDSLFHQTVQLCCSRQAICCAGFVHAAADVHFLCGEEAGIALLFAVDGPFLLQNVPGFGVLLHNHPSFHASVLFYALQCLDLPPQFTCLRVRLPPCQWYCSHLVAEVSLHLHLPFCANAPSMLQFLHSKRCCTPNVFLGSRFCFLQFAFMHLPTTFRPFCPVLGLACF